ncbi:TPA_asm: virion structural protein [Caudoviricetes sp. vir520]|nr:TPA_asm: virion structural protein [Caudoviricetes sp. vir520]
MNTNMRDDIITVEGWQNIYGIKNFQVPPQCTQDPNLDEDLVRLKYYKDHLPIGAYTEGCRVFNSANINIPNAAWTTLTFDSERYDTDSIHSTIANTDRLTCQTAGKYQITGNVIFDSNNVGFRLLAIEYNGATLIGRSGNMALNATVTPLSLSTLYELSVSDYVTLKVYQTSGGALNVRYTGNDSPEFMMQRIG